MNFKDKIKKGKFVVTAELEPPKGTDVELALKKLKYLKDVDAVNVTACQRAVLKLSSLAMCKLLVDKKIEPIFQLTCRDRNRIALQSDLLGASALGIKNVLALSGDHPKLGDHPTAKAVYDVDSIQLLDIIKRLNNGFDLAGNKLEGKTDFFIGAAANPGADDLELEFIRIKKKIEAGAEFFQTQVVYDAESFKEFIEKIKPLKAKIIVGVLPLKSVKMAQFMNENVPGIKVPSKLIKELEESKDPAKKGIEQVVEIIKELKELCAGVHIMTLGKEEIVPEIVKGVGV